MLTPIWKNSAGPTESRSAPTAGTSEPSFIPSSNGTSRKTRTGNLSQRRVWRCHNCHKQFSVLTGTPLHGTKISVRKWVFVIFKMRSSKNGVSAREIQRKYGLCSRTAWFMMHRIREMMKGEYTEQDRMEGVIVADETYIGGKPTRMNHKTRARYEARGVQFKSGRGTHKIPVVTVIEKNSGQARSQSVPTVTSQTMDQLFKENVVTSRSLLWTDTLPVYFEPGRKFVAHEMVDHGKHQYMTKTGATTNAAENFFGQLKRSLDGTHHHVTVKHLARYLAEYDYRYSHRKISDTERMAALVGSTPIRRLTYSQVRQDGTVEAMP